MEERQLSPCHDGDLQPFLCERGSNVEEKFSLYKEPDCLLITSIVLQSHCSQVSLPFFYILESTYYKKDNSFSFSQKIQQAFIWSTKWNCYGKKQSTSLLWKSFDPTRAFRESSSIANSEHWWMQPMLMFYFLEFIFVLPFAYGIW